MTSSESKTCAACGRRMSWRRRWARSWDQVRYCSDACRRQRVGATDRALERAILDLLGRCAGGATICPSQAARAVDPLHWKGLMQPARRAARRLAADGRLEIVQHSRVADPSTARGPIRLRRPARTAPARGSG